jgi:hypothetical protein
MTLSATWKCAILVIILALSSGTIGVFAEEQNLGRVRIASFVCPRQVAPGSVFSVNLDVEYEVRTNATMRAAIFSGLTNASTPLWQSEAVSLVGGGDKVWVINLTAPSTEGTVQLSAYAYYLDNGVWKFYSDTVLGPGFRQVFIKVARNATLQIDLGVPEVELTVGNQSETTTRAGVVGVSLPVGISYWVSVPSMQQYQNSTRKIFDGWQDRNNQTSRIITLDGDTQLVGSYRTQYLLRVISTVPNYSYQRWYDAGSNVTLQAVGSVSIFWPLGLFGGKYVFSGWSGDFNSGSSEINFTMNSPKTIDANFSIDYGFFMVFAVIVTAGIIGQVVLFTLKRRKAAQSRAESASSTATCPNCGEIIDEGWVHCTNCGRKVDSLKDEPTEH